MEGKTLKKTSHSMIRRFHEIFSFIQWTGFFQIISWNLIMDKIQMQFRKVFDSIVAITDYGRPMKPFFTKIPNFGAWSDKGFFGMNCQHPIWYSAVSPLSMFSITYSTILSPKNYVSKPTPQYLILLKVRNDFGPSKLFWTVTNSRWMKHSVSG